MKGQTGRELRIGSDDGFLDGIDRAITERMKTGYADEARYGFPARLANATPPVDDTFQRVLRARILTELTRNTEKEKRTMTIRNHLQNISYWRLSLAGGLAAMLILTLAFAISQHIRVGEPEMRVAMPTVAPASQLASGDVDALADQLNEEPASRTVVVFPGDYAETLARHIQHEVVPLTLKGALAMPAIHATLGAALPSSGLVDVIMVDPEATDAERSVRIALEQQLYRLYRPGETGTETFGALERNQYVVGPEDVDVTLEPIGAVFENGVELVAAGVLDDLRPGEPLRLAFDWRVMEPGEESADIDRASVVVFAHLICDGGRLVAQRDAVPGNGLSPVAGWELGELVRDQFALQLPTELLAGECEVQVGIYNSTSGQRYRVTGPEAGPYVVVKRWALED
jgi:hypothetical protein